jgi:hypothetical protein
MRSIRSVSKIWLLSPFQFRRLAQQISSLCYPYAARLQTEVTAQSQTTKKKAVKAKKKKTVIVKRRKIQKTKSKKIKHGGISIDFSLSSLLPCCCKISPSS